MKILVSSLEPSANLHLGEILKEEKFDIVGIFDEKFGTPLYGSREFAVMGFIDVIPKILKAKEAIKNFPVPMATLIRNFVISKAEDFLKSVVIIDTPGIDPADVRGFDYDASITKESIDLAHYVFWVMDVADGDLGRESLEYIKNVKEQKDMSTGQQKSAKKSSLAKRRENAEKKDKKTT